MEYYAAVKKNEEDRSQGVAARPSGMRRHRHTAPKVGGRGGQAGGRTKQWRQTAKSKSASHSAGLVSGLHFGPSLGCTLAVSPPPCCPQPGPRWGISTPPPQSRLRPPAQLQPSLRARRSWRSVWAPVLPPSVGPGKGPRPNPAALSPGSRSGRGCGW